MTETTTPAPTYAQESLRAGTLAAGTQLLLDFIQREPALGRALSLIDTTDLRGPLDQAGLHALLAEAEAERDRCAALAERDARREESGQRPCTTCLCGHSDTAHSRRLTEDGRLPCTRSDCFCHDLTFE
ncbi:hypothetical protein ACFXKF_36150 [Streptomyces scopuliridis]|uniref:hypothetical protein n=1 Tax=Streptomyces scopuliridis TaxID=452529 RepID=UPI0036A2AA02